MKRVWLCLSLLLCAASARADVIVVVPPVYQGINGSDVAASLVATVSAFLGQRHHTVILPNDAAERMPAGQNNWCGEPDCMERYRVATNAAAAISVRVFRVGRGAGPATSFQIGIQPKPGLEYADGAVIEVEYKLEQQATSVLEKLWKRYDSNDPQPRLVVTGSPAGAMVYVDDALKGPIPAYLTLPMGMHRVRVEKIGYESATRLVSLQTAGLESEMDIRLEPARRELPHARRSEMDTHPQMTQKHRLGVALLTVGTPLLTVAGAYAVTVATLDADACATSGPICERKGLDTDRGPRLGAGLAVGAVGLVSMITGAVIVKRERRLRTSLVASAQGALVSVWRDLE